MKKFITIKENIQTEITVQKSKFICNLIRVDTQKEAEEIIKVTKKKYHDARHNCIAYRIKQNDQIIEKSSDDGEPSGTAGQPMLNILEKNYFCNVVAVITRYFGGILLGTGGLVRAYSDCLLQAMSSCNKIEMCMGYEFEATLKYNNLDSFKYYCKINDIFIEELNYSEIVICKIQIEDNKKEKLIEDFDTKKVNLINLKYLSKKMINKSIIK